MAKSKDNAEKLEQLLAEDDDNGDISQVTDLSRSENRNAQGISNEPVDEGENVAVMVRCRPLIVGSNLEPNSANQERQEAVVKVDQAKKSVQVADRQFFFDQVFETGCDNEQVYMQSARRLVDCAFRGYNCAIFLYGQTGTGKTYTHSSLTLAAFEHLFSLIQGSNKTMRFLIRASYYELYNEQIRDLLAAKSKRVGANSTNQQKSLELRESKERGVYIKDLTCFLVNNLAELKKLKQFGDKRRTITATKMNEHSSRSHSIFSITIETVSATTIQVANSKTSSGADRKSSFGANNKNEPLIRVGHLNLIDLAGSERQSKSGASGSALKEASQINLSLTCLSLVIRALVDNKTDRAHIPYRNSKLTRLLSNTLGGNSKTILIACISVARSNLDETLNTLRFASSTKRIKNKAVINEDPKDALLRKYREQLEELRMKLSGHEKVTDRNKKSGTQNENKLKDESDLHKTKDEIEDQQQELKLNKQLELLKAKIMFGGENLLDKLELHDRLLEASKLELEERKQEESKLRERLMSKKQNIDQVVQSKGSLEGQLEYLNDKLSQVINLYKSSKLELADSISEHEQLKEQLLQSIRSTSKEIKYVDCIIEDFIPREYIDLINAYAQHDDQSEEWQIKYIALSGNNIVQTRRLLDSAAAATSGQLKRNQESKFANSNTAGGGQIAVRRDRELSAGVKRSSSSLSRLKKGSSRPTSCNRVDPFLRLSPDKGTTSK